MSAASPVAEEIARIRAGLGPEPCHENWRGKLDGYLNGSVPRDEFWKAYDSDWAAYQSYWDQYEAAREASPLIRLAVAARTTKPEPNDSAHQAPS